MRVAAVDIGTNTVLLLVAESNANGDLVAVEERATITRLGEGVDRTRALAPEAIERTKACLTNYAAIAGRLGASRVDVVGTSAMRDAQGSEAVRAHVKSAFGVDARVISGDEEARLTFAGALSGMQRDVGVGEAREELVYDIGGGSTEVVVGSVDDRARPTSITFAQSFDVGSVRLTERHVRSDPPTRDELEAITRDCASSFHALTSVTTKTSVPIGIAGTMTTLAAVSLRLDPYDGARVHGFTLTTAALREIVRELAKAPLATRRALPGLEPKRADVIVAGGLIALALLEAIGATRVQISDRGVRWGLAASLIANP